MQHTEIIKREDGSRNKSVSIKVEYLPTLNIYTYKVLVGDIKLTRRNESSFVTPAEIHAAKLKCWEKLKP